MAGSGQSSITHPEPAEEYRQRLRAAELVLVNNQTKPARQAYETLLTLRPDDPGVIFPLAVLRYFFGDTRAATELMQDHYRRFPLRSTSADALGKRPLILKVRGYNGTRVHMAKRSNGDIRPGMRGGHFTTEFLLQGSGIAECEYTIGGAGPVDPAHIPPHDVLLNTISEPDLEAPALHALQQFLDAGYEGPVLNPPAQVMRTSRDGNYQRFKSFDNLTFPNTLRFRFNNATAAEATQIIAENGFDMPFIFRRTGTQTARTTALIRNKSDMETYAPNGVKGDFYAIAYREILWQNAYFRKLRLFSIDGRFYPVVCHLDKIWNVHGANRKEIMRNDEALMAEEKRFLADWQSYVGVKAVTALEAAAEDTGMDFFGIDFTLDDEGCPFIYELNASMRHSFDHARNFPYKLPYDQAITDAFSAMIRGRSGTKGRV